MWDDLTHLQLIVAVAAGLGLSAAAGFRVFVPVLAVGLAGRLGWIELGDGFVWLQSTPALLVLGTATVAEIAAYYIPWVDNLLDSLASPVALLAGTVVFAAVLPEMDTGLKWLTAVIAGGGTAGTVQAGSVLLRALSSATTGGLGNPVLSSLETGGSILAVLLALLLPLLAGILVLIGLVWLIVLFFRRRRRRKSRATSF